MLLTCKERVALINAAVPEAVNGGGTAAGASATFRNASDDGILTSPSILRSISDSARAWTGCSVATHGHAGV